VLFQTRQAWRSACYRGRCSTVGGAVTELEAFAAGLRIQANALAQTSDYIDRQQGEEPEASDD
jgi:hypothetical protein